MTLSSFYAKTTPILVIFFMLNKLKKIYIQKTV